MGVVVRRYIDILIIIINFPYSTCISSFFGSSIPTSLFIFKMFIYTVHGLLLNAELESACLSGYVRLVVLALYCLDLTQLGAASVAQLVEQLPRKQYAVGLNPT